MPHCMAFTLISISCLDCAGCSVLIEDNACVIHGACPEQKFLGSVPRIHGLYHIELSAVISPMSNHHANAIDTPMGIEKLHCKLRHLNLQTLQEIVTKGVISGIKIDTKSTTNLCKSCIQGKAHQQPFPKESKTKYNTYGEKIVTDLWGPAQVTSLGGHLYCQFYHNMATGEDHIDFLKAKSEP